MTSRRRAVSTARSLLLRWRAELVQRPRHVALGTFAGGLALSNWMPWQFVALAVSAIGAGDVYLNSRGQRRPHRAKWLVVGACLPLGAFIGAERTTALERSSLPLNTEVQGRATILELPRTDSAGRRSITVEFRGERVLVRPPPWRPALPATVGAYVKVQGRLRAPDLVARARKAHATLDASSVRATGSQRGGLPGIVDGIRTRAERALSRGLPPPEAGLLRGMVLGQDAALPLELRDQMRASGLAHLTAASGGNIALLATLALACGALAGIPIRPRLGLVLLLIALYVPLAGAGPSIQRAGIMGAAAVVATLASRPADRWYGLVVAAALTLLIDARAVSDPGWQMSFAAVLALIGLARPLADRIRAPRPIADATAMTALATLATAPIAAAHFGTASLAGLPANVLAALVVAPIMWLGFLAAAVGQVAPGLAAPLAAACGPLAGFMVALAESAADWPGAALQVGWPVVTLAAAGVLCLIATWLAGRLRPGTARRVLVLAAVVVANVVFASRAGAPAPPPEGTLRVTALDVGQGDAILVQSGSAAVLFDAGVPDAPTIKRLHAAGVRRLDAFVITHGDADHAGGAPAVIREAKPRAILDARNRALAGDEVAIGSLHLRFLWPTAEARSSGAEPNDLSAVAVASVGGRSALLTGDAESEVLLGLELPDVDILKVSHHGSADEGLPELLERVRPEAALISAGRHNDYGHPTPSVLAALRGVAVRRTDTDGSVAVEASSHGLATFAGR